MVDILDELEAEILADLMQAGGPVCEHPTHDLSVFSGIHRGPGKYLLLGQCLSCNGKGPVFWACEKFYLSGMMGAVACDCSHCGSGHQLFKNFYRIKGRWSPNGPLYA